jgi:ADP-ribosylglycohydrolase
MQRYCRWWREGHLSSTGYCFDIGNTVADALRRFQLAGDPFAGRPEAHYGGNGSLMRLAPIPLAFFTDPGMAISQAALMSKTTHGAPEPVDACRFYPMRRKAPSFRAGI